MLEEVKQKAKEQQALKQAESHKRAADYHRAFVQNEAGMKFYQGLIQRVLHAPPTTDTNELLKREGIRTIAKEITDHISFIENEG